MTVFTANISRVIHLYFQNMFTLFFLFVNNEVRSFPFNFADEIGLVNEKQLEQLQESDTNLLRAVALFIGIVLVFSLIICLCAMYWCICWALHCPGVNTMRSFVRGTSESWSRWRSVSRPSIRNGKRKRNPSDPPPPYDVILEEFEGDELPPPTYAEALCNEIGAS